MTALPVTAANPCREPDNQQAWERGRRAAIRGLDPERARVEERGASGLDTTMLRLSWTAGYQEGLNQADG